MSETNVDILKCLETEIYDFTTGVINEGADTLGISRYNDDGQDLSEDKEWLNNFLDRLYDYVHGSGNLSERDWWAMETGRAQMLLRIKDMFGIKVAKEVNKILEWISNLF